eukprot:TRINITY_DN22684_c0_g2_i5.p1 TRINITY_DN22684_c0_g2~~TRINITY_DN22684_c0_g2_i5.p1  ORF type:complete len:656 (+),score=193.99 TRINITY_DN22684_c0_g2_i5:93-1970(+)
MKTMICVCGLLATAAALPTVITVEPHGVTYGTTGTDLFRYNAAAGHVVIQEPDNTRFHSLDVLEVWGFEGDDAQFYRDTLDGALVVRFKTTNSSSIRLPGTFVPGVDRQMLQRRSMVEVILLRPCWRWVFVHSLRNLEAVPEPRGNLGDLVDVQPIASSGRVALHGDFGVIGSQIVERHGGHWAFGQDLPATEYCHSSQCVAVHDGKVVIAHSTNRKVIIFEQDSTTQDWKLVAEFVEPELGLFGESVSIDETTAVVGAPNSNTAVVYTRSANGSWAESARLTPNASDHEYFGGSVDKEGCFIFVGAKTGDRTYIYTQGPDGQWSAPQVLDRQDPSLPSPYQFGWSLDAHGDEVAIGAYRDNVVGRVFVYTLSGGVWVLSQTLAPFGDRDAEGSSFGHHVKMGDHNLLVGDDGERSIYRFVKHNGRWVEANTIRAPEGSSYDFGYSIAFSQDYLLAGGSQPVLMGPAVQRMTLSGRVVDAAGVSVYMSVVDGFLQQAKTDMEGLYSLSVPLGWSGSLRVLTDASSVVDVVAVQNDTRLPDIVLDKQVFYSCDILASGIFEQYSLNVTGYDELVTAEPFRFSLDLPNGWSGEIVPLSDRYRFTPDKIVIENMKSFVFNSLRATPKL